MILNLILIFYFIYCLLFIVYSIIDFINSSSFVYLIN